MKKHQLWYAILFLIVVSCGLLGFYNKRSYTNLTMEEAQFEEQACVAVIPEEYAVEECDRMKEELPRSPYILKVVCVGELEHEFMADRQLVEIQTVYENTNKNETLGPGQQVYLYSTHWRTDIAYEPYSIERGFVNILNIDETYLVCLQEEKQDLFGDVPVYELADDYLIAPVFSYEDRNNTPCLRVNAKETYVPYSEVKNNEFFGESEVAIAAWIDLKTFMLEQYP